MLYIPGPVDLTDEIRLAQAQEMINHRSPEYHELHTKITERLINLFECEEAYVITGSGTAGIESMIASIVGKEDKMICLTNGVFGKRFAETARIYCDVIEKKWEYGKGINLERAKEFIDTSGANILGMVYNETSTAVGNHIKDICKYAKEKGMIVLIDAVSAWCGFPLDMRWGIDAFVVGSQKGLGAPPGLSMVALNRLAIEKLEKNDIKTYYLSLKKCRAYHHKKKETPFTPAVSLLYALETALEILLKEGLENRIERHRKTGEFVREELKKRGFELFAEKGFESNTLTAFKTDKANEIKAELSSRGIIVGSGQEELKGKILRIAHIGNYELAKYQICFAVLDDILHKL